MILSRLTSFVTDVLDGQERIQDLNLVQGGGVVIGGILMKGEP